MDGSRIMQKKLPDDQKYQRLAQQTANVNDFENVYSHWYSNGIGARAANPAPNEDVNAAADDAAKMLSDQKLLGWLSAIFSNPYEIVETIARNRFLSEALRAKLTQLRLDEDIHAEIVAEMDAPPELQQQLAGKSKPHETAITTLETLAARHSELLQEINTNFEKRQFPRPTYNELLAVEKEIGAALSDNGIKIAPMPELEQQVAQTLQESHSKRNEWASNKGFKKG
jgi:hypothetical protein